MSPADVINTLSARGVELWQERGTLRYRARVGTLTEQDRATLRAHKVAILKALASNYYCYRCRRGCSALPGGHSAIDPYRCTGTRAEGAALLPGRTLR